MANAGRAKKCTALQADITISVKIRVRVHYRLSLQTSEVQHSEQAVAWCAFRRLLRLPFATGRDSLQ